MFPNRRTVTLARVAFAILCCALVLEAAGAVSSRADTLTFTEDFISTTWRDSAWTTAEWDTIAGQVTLPSLGLAPQGGYNTTGNAFASAAMDSVLLVADGTGGLVSLDITDPAAPALLTSRATLDQARDIALSGNLAVLAIGSLGLQIIDATDPAVLTSRGDVDVPGYTTSVALNGNLAYLAQSNLGVAVVDITDPDAPVFVRDLATGDWARGVAVAGTALAVADGDSGLTMLDISLPDDPSFLARLVTEGTVLDVTVDGGRAFLAAGSAGVIIADISNPAAPVRLGSFPTIGTCRHAVVRNDSLWVAAGSSGLYLLDVSDPANPVQLERNDTLGEAYHTTLAGQTAWLCDGVEGVKSFVADPLGLDTDRDTARSLDINSTGDDAVRAGLTADYADSIRFELSNDGGTTWLEVVPDGTLTDFPSPGKDLRWRATLVQTGPWPGPVLRSLTITWERILQSAEITAVTDIPGDTGGQVRLVFNASVHDTLGDPDPVSEYSVYRRYAAAKAYPPGQWDYLLTLPADREAEYAVVAPTLADSSGSDPAWTAFFVRARTVGGFFYDSPVDSGYSVNNLQPPAPTGFRALPDLSGGHQLAWDPSPLPDFSHFAIYRASDPDTPIQPGTLLGVSLNTSYYDGQPGAWYYKLTVVNTQGQESEPAAALQPSPVADTAAGPALTCAPNPCNPSTVISFTVPEDAATARLAVYDVRGRLVRMLLDGPLPAGPRTVRWRGRDDTGRPAASGAYFCRLDAGGRNAMTRITLVR